jgi:prepilin-type N-terminal cleavage/methylation domain-containing protein
MRSFGTKSTMGFSLMEMLIVVVVIGLTTLFVFPRAGAIFDHTQVRSARTAVANMVNSAKISARQHNLESSLAVAGNLISVTNASGTIQSQNMRAHYGVIVSTSGTFPLRFDQRGMRTGSNTTATLLFSRGGFTDSVVVDGYGRIRR